MDFVLCDWELYRKFLEVQEVKTQVHINRGSESELTELGFESVNYDGVELTWEYGLPKNELSGATETSIAFGLNMSEIELCSMQSKLFVDDRDDDITTESDLILVDFYGQMRINPRNQVLFVGNGDS